MSVATKSVARLKIAMSVGLERRQKQNCHDIYPWKRFRELHPEYRTQYENMMQWIDERNLAFKAREVRGINRSSGWLYRVLANLVRNGLLKRNGTTYEKTNNWNLKRAVEVTRKHAQLRDALLLRLLLRRPWNERRKSVDSQRRRDDKPAPMSKMRTPTKDAPPHQTVVQKQHIQRRNPSVEWPCLASVVAADTRAGRITGAFTQDTKPAET